MTKIEVEDIIGPCAITFLSSFQLATFARQVGMARAKYKIQPPAIDGDENFVRIYRAHQNSLEFYPLFVTGLWTSSLMLHQAPACAFGVIYMFGRQRYFSGYSESVEKRMSGLKMCVLSLHGLWLCSLLGLANQGFMAYCGKSVLNYLKSFAN